MTQKPHWHPEEYKRAMDLIARGHTIPSAAAIIGRSPAQLREKMRWEGMSKARREELREMTNMRRRNKYIASMPRGPGAYATTSGRPAPDMLAEAQKRLYAPRTISQEIFGDPPPGYSALDRKRQGLPA